MDQAPIDVELGLIGPGQRHPQDHALVGDDQTQLVSDEIASRVKAPIGLIIARAAL